MILAKILYFIKGAMPSPEDIKAASILRGTAMFRNANVVYPEDKMELCDGVAGCVPANYAAYFPTAEEAIAKKEAELHALMSKVNDDPAPIIQTIKGK